MKALAGLLLVAACGSTSEPVPGDITVTVITPTPGEEMLASEHPMITVSGMVASTTTFGTLEAWVNGTQVDVAADGSFTTDITPTLGIDHVKVEGGDGGALHGQELDVLWAPDYLPTIAGQTGFDVTGAIELDLGQRFFDQRLFGTTLDLTTDPVVAHDLSSALELILWHIDLASLLNGSIQVGNGNASLDISIPSATPSQILVDAKVLGTSAIDLSIDLDGVFLAMTGNFTFGNRVLVVDGGIAADMHASARLSLAIAQDGSIDVTVTDVTTTVGPLVPSFVGPDGDELDAFIQIANSDFRVIVERLIADQLIPTFTDKVPPLLENLLGAADSLLDNVSFQLDPGLGTAVTLQLDSHIGALDVSAGAVSGHVGVREDLTILTGNAPIHGTSRGAARLDADPAAPSTASSSVHLTLRQELLNTLLHSLWNSGLLEGHATFGGLSASVSAKLPPIVRPTPPESPCTIDGVRCDFILQLGQLEVALADFDQSFGISATAGARIIVDGNTVSIKIQEIPDLHVWETSAVDGVLTPIAVRDVIANAVWPDLFGAISDKLKITLPLPDLAALGLDQLAPGLANAQLLLQMQQRPSVTNGFLTLGADLELSTPPPP